MVLLFRTDAWFGGKDIDFQHSRLRSSPYLLFTLARSLSITWCLCAILVLLLDQTQVSCRHVFYHDTTSWPSTGGSDTLSSKLQPGEHVSFWRPQHKSQHKAEEGDHAWYLTPLHGLVLLPSWVGVFRTGDPKNMGGLAFPHAQSSQFRARLPYTPGEHQGMQ